MSIVSFGVSGVITEKTKPIIAKMKSRNTMIGKETIGTDANSLNGQKVRNDMTLNEIICANVRYLAKKNKMLIGEVEESVNLCKGYFSRKDKDDSAMPIDRIYLIAQIFNVSLDDMCSNLPLIELEATAKEFGYKLVPIDEVDNEKTV